MSKDLIVKCCTDFPGYVEAVSENNEIHIEWIMHFDIVYVLLISFILIGLFMHNKCVFKITTIFQDSIRTLAISSLNLFFTLISCVF